MEVFETHSLCGILLQQDCPASLDQDLGLLLLFGHIIGHLERKNIKNQPLHVTVQSLKSFSG